MVTVGLADNHPVVHQGIQSYFKKHSEISIEGVVNHFDMVEDMVKQKKIDVLLLDLELDGLPSTCICDEIALKAAGDIGVVAAWST